MWKWNTRVVHKGTYKNISMEGINLLSNIFQVSFYAPWIDCIIETSRATGGAREAVEAKCNEVAKSLVPKCLSEDDLIFEDLDLRTGDDTFNINTCSSV